VRSAVPTSQGAASRDSGSRAFWSIGQTSRIETKSVHHSLHKSAVVQRLAVCLCFKWSRVQFSATLIFLVS
jgi:hypothetical protein